MLFTILLAAHIVLAVLLIGVILIQQGKGATAGAAFGSGASSTVFGARGSASFLTRLTAGLALLFFSNSLLLAYLYGQTVEPQSLLDKVSQNAPVVIDVPPDTAAADVPAAIEAAIKNAADVPLVPGATDNGAPMPEQQPSVVAQPGEIPADVPNVTGAANEQTATPATLTTTPPAAVNDVPVVPAPAAPETAVEADPRAP